MPPLLQTGIGIVAPYDFALDRELWRWAPDDVSLYLTRMPYVPLAATVEMAMHISEPALVARGALDVLAVSPSSPPMPVRRAASSTGWPARRPWSRRWREAGAPAAVTTSGALLVALRHLGITRIAVVTPYTEDLTDGLRRYLAEAGVEVVATAGLGLTSEIWTVPYDVTADLVRDTDTPDAEAVFVSAPTCRRTT